MSNHFVYAVFDTLAQGRRAMEALIQAGVPVSAISLLADDASLEGSNC